MFDILFVRTFSIVWVMLLITAWAAYLNKTKSNNNSKSWWGIIISMFALLFAIMMFSDVFPLNLILVWLFAAVMGWMISPAIQVAWNNRKIKSFLNEKRIVLKKGETLNADQSKELEEYLIAHQSNEEWNKIVAQAMLSTALAVFATVSFVFISDVDFSFMWMFLFIALIVLIILWILNIFVFKSRIFSLVKAYFWVIIFTWYLIYDFNTLEKLAGDDTWWTAVRIAVNIYLDIINLFLYLLEILWDS